MNKQRFSKKLISIATLMTMLATFIVSPTVLAQDVDLGEGNDPERPASRELNPSDDQETEDESQDTEDQSQDDTDLPELERVNGNPNVGNNGNGVGNTGSGNQGNDSNNGNAGGNTDENDQPLEDDTTGTEEETAEGGTDVTAGEGDTTEDDTAEGGTDVTVDEDDIAGDDETEQGTAEEEQQIDDVNGFSIEAPDDVTITDITLTKDAEAINDMVAGRAFEDANGNAVYDDGEPLMKGIRVVLYHSEPGANAFSSAGDTYTDVNGEYSFSGLQNNYEYVVSFRNDDPSYNFTNPENFGENDTIDSDVEAFVGYTMGSGDIFVFDSSTIDVIKYEKVRSAPGGYKTDEFGSPILAGTTNVWAMDAGLIQGASVNGKVWLDQDKDGLQDEFEPGQEGVYVLLNIVVPDDSENGLRSIVRQSVLTDAEGNYTFNNVHPGNYYVSVPKVLAQSLGGGNNFPDNCNAYTTRDAGEDDTIDSDVEGIDGYYLGSSHGFDVTSESVDNVDAGLICNNVSGVVWEDVNANALRDAGEPRLEGFRVLLYQQTDFTDSYTQAGETFTDANGYYNFDNLVDGYIYTVGFDRAGMPYNFTYEQNTGDDDTIDSDVEPWVGYSMGSSDRFVFDSTKVDSDRLDHIRVSPGGYVLDGEGNPAVNGTVNTGHVDAGLVKYSAVTGKVWNDLNKDGIQDEFEVGQEGINVFLNQIRPDDSENGIRAVSVGHAITDADGNYAFDDLPPGKYYVSVPKVLAGSLGGGNNFPDNCNAYTNRDAGEDDTIDSDVEAVDGYYLGSSHNFELGANESEDNVDAGLICNNLTGVVWEDANANALQDDGETLLEDFRVILYEATDPTGGFTPIATDYTDATGRYNFNNLVEGNIYTLSFRRAEGMSYNFTYEQNTGADDTIDSDVEPWVGYSMGSSDRFVFDPTQVNSDRVEHVRSAPGGLVLDGGDVVVNGTVDTGHVDAGLVKHSAINGKVWDDLNKNGIQDEFEVGREGINVFLNQMRPDDSEDGLTSVSVGHTVTDADGNYTFGDLRPGKYYVSVPKVLAGSLGGGNNFPAECNNYTTRDAGEDDTVDSDVEAVDGYYLGSNSSFDLATNEVVNNVDAGLICNNLTGVVWDDVNANALQDDGEPLFEDFRVILYEATDPTGGFTPIATDYTDATGRYNFNNLVEGNIYTVIFRRAADMSYKFTHQQNTGDDDTIDSDVEPWIGYSMGSSDRFVFDPTQVNSDRVEHVRSAPGGLVLDGGEVVVNGTVDTGHVSAGLSEYGTISGRVWHDANENGLEEDGEVGKEGVQVFLDIVLADDSENGVTAVSQGIALTDADGVYTFSQLVPGTYFVSVRETFRGERNLPAECTGYTQQNVGEDDTIDSDVEPTVAYNLGGSHSFVLEADGVVTDVDAGLLCEATEEEENNDNGGSTGDNGDDGEEGDDNNDDESNDENDSNTTPGGDTTTTTNTTTNRGGGGGGGGFVLPQNTNPEADFTGQSLDDVSLDPCLQLLARDLTFTDQTDVNSEILKETALLEEGYNGATQYVISGYGNKTNETGSSTVGLDNPLLRVEAAKIVTTAILCYQIYNAEDIDGDFTFNDIAKVDTENQWYADIAYTAHHLGLIQGRDGNAELLEAIAKEEFVTMIVRAYEAKYGEITVDEDVISVDIDPNAWYYNSYLKAKAIGLLTPALESTGTPLSRGDAFMAIVKAALLLNAYTPEAKITVSELLNN